ncbi:hypothetical protein [Flavobacterium oreochromis]|uniref:hypothetical protein n=1 Tax=Flavobacterium oreochromis TaxID=2906078 RepID=UPI00385FC0EC
MNKEAILEELRLDLEEGAFSSFISNFEEAKKIFSKSELANELAQLISNNYTSFKEDAMDYCLGIILKSDYELGVIDGDKNPFFQLAVMKGSMKLLQCLFEESYSVYYKSIDEDQQFDFNANLSLAAHEINDEIMSQSQKFYKGLHYNGGFLDNGKVVLNTEDYGIMNNITELYNAIIGRNEIIEYLDTL